jgi:chemotaxis protein CheY-P-specific phosphatase CheC
MDPLKRIDKILEAIQVRVQDEVASLLGVDFVLGDIEKRPVTKEEAFDNLAGKQICAKMELVGEIEGNGALFMGIKDAIRLGGTLIMIPASELDEVISREEYGEEIEDSYGEIANIIAGSFTKDFEEMYSKSFRFVRKEQEKLVPVKVDIDSDEPVKNEIFYQVAFPMILDGIPMGKMIMLMPAASFGLQWDDKSVSTGDKASRETDTSREEKKEDGEVEVSQQDKVSADSARTRSNFNVEKHRKRIDKLLAVCREKMSSELGALLGVDIDLSDMQNSFVSKEDFFFDHASGKQVMADMEVVGDLEDKSFFSVGLKDAIYLGGLLIMLPPSELENVVSEEEFGEEAQDAYGEVANIVSGVYTSVFEEQYTKSLRFIKKRLQQVVPMKVDPDSDEPVPNVPYYLNSMTLNIEGKSYGKVHMLFPVDMLQLSTFGQQEQDETVEKQVLSPEKKNEETVPSPSDKTADFNLERHKKRVDKLLGLCKEKMADEVGALLGIDVQLKDLENRIVSKEDFFFEEVSGKQVIADMEVVGEIEDQSYLVISQKDAIRIGGTLIMLPESELQSSVEDGDFSEDIEDAYGEIANIISGVYTAVFEEGYTRQIRFIKKGLNQVLPMKVDPESDEPFPDQEYYVSTMNLVLADNEAGKLHMVFPSAMLQLDGLGKEELEEGSDSVKSSASQAPSGDAADTAKIVSVAADDGRGPVDILLIGDDMTEIEKLQSVLTERGFVIRVLSFKDQVHNYIPGELKAVYLVMREINEQGFGVAIKVSSSCSLPLIAAAPGWTKTKVIKAVKYGIRDILLTPASTEDIEENISNNLLQLAA